MKRMYLERKKLNNKNSGTIYRLQWGDQFTASSIKSGPKGMGTIRTVSFFVV